MEAVSWSDQHLGARLPPPPASTEFLPEASATMPETYQVRVADDSTVFSAAHFITYDRQTCEPLHGHNFRVAVTVSGPLDENHYVVDFVALKKLVGQVLAELDHRVLLPADHEQIRLAVGDEEVEVTFPGRRWVFPRVECAVLPMANTTVELLARYIGRCIAGRLPQAASGGAAEISVEVEESPGWSATCRLSLPGLDD
jgi:6-pyruvoyltetrahydropterin/6-carboxytetrahydropterin synthase